jgi:localization factor PodJL
MKSGVPWQVKGVRRHARETAQEAARRSGMSVGEWLDTVIIDSAVADGVDPPAEALDDERYRDNVQPRRPRYADYDSRHRRPSEDDFAAVHDRLETLSLQLDQLARANSEAARMPAREEETPRRIGDAISRLDRRLDQLISEGRSASSEIEQRMSAVDRAVAGLQPERPRLPSAAAPPATPLDQALVEIAARQQALDGGSQPAGDWPARADLPRASTQSLSGLEHQLRNITTRIETLRPGIDTAVETLRDDLAEIGVMLKEAMPRRAVEALEQEVRNLSERLHGGRSRGNGGGAAIEGLERGLAEVRDALRALTPAENLVGFDDAVKGLSDKIDRIATSSQDPAALQQLEGTIVALRGIVSHVASNDALAKLSEEMRVLASRVEQVANSAGNGADVLATLEQRIATIADALHSRNRGEGGSHELEAVLLGLTDKLERIALTRGDQMALGHLEDRITKLVEKLDASDSRLNHLEAIERGLAELLIHLEHQRLPQAVRSAAAAPPAVDVLKRDVARTVDSLEAVHGTVEHVVDRLAMIETDMRGRPVAPADEPAPQRIVTPPAATPPPASLPAAGTLQAPATPVPQAVALLAAEPPAPKPVRPPQEERRAIDPSLPPDYPLEPGVSGSRNRQPGSPADRIAASEAALGPAKPPVIPDPAGGKADFIAAARRAAQAAVNETPGSVYSDKRPATEKAKPAAASIGSRISDRMRKLLVRSSAALVLVASLYAGVQVFNLFDQMTPSSTDVAAVPDPAPADAAPVNRATQSSERDAAPAAPLTTATVIPAEPPSTAMFGPTTKSVADRVTTGSVPQPEPSAQPRLPAEPPAATRATAADRLPAAIGSGGLRTAAVRGDAAAEYEIAVRYAEGRGVPPNMTAAAEWFERAAKQGLPPAQFRLGGFYEKGLGVKKDLEAARRLYLAAAQAGNAKAMHNLAVLYAEGAEGKPDYATAARWFRKAADHGVSDSQYNLAILYARGIGVGQNLAEAYKWFALAAREGDKDSAKKRDDVGGRLDQPSLAAALRATETWAPEPQPETAIQVRIPAGGWDGIAAPKQKARTVGPKAEAPAVRP